MALPKQVQQQIAELEAFEKQMAAPPDGENTDQDNNDAPAPIAPEPEGVPTPPVVAEVDSWEHKYKVLAGKYDAEVPRLHSNVKELGSKLADALHQIAELKAPTPTPVDRTVTDKDVEIFGKDLIDLQRRIAEDVSAKFDTQLKDLRAKNEALQAQLEQTGNQVTTMTFEQRLGQALPDFDEINVDPKWVAWLDEYDPLLRNTRRVVAQEAFSTGDVDAIVDYVNVFRSTTDAPKPKSRQAELERQVAPSRTSSSTSTATPQGKMYTSAQVDSLYAKVRQMNIRGEFDAATKLDSEITAAYSEGRVVG